MTGNPLARTAEDDLALDNSDYNRDRTHRDGDTGAHREAMWENLNCQLEGRKLYKEIVKAATPGEVYDILCSDMDVHIVFSDYRADMHDHMNMKRKRKGKEEIPYTHTLMPALKEVWLEAFRQEGPILSDVVSYTADGKEMHPRQTEPSPAQRRAWAQGIKHFPDPEGEFRPTPEDLPNLYRREMKRLILEGIGGGDLHQGALMVYRAAHTGKGKQGVTMLIRENESYQTQLMKDDVPPGKEVPQIQDYALFLGPAKELTIPGLIRAAEQVLEKRPEDFKKIKEEEIPAERDKVKRERSLSRA